MTDGKLSQVYTLGGPDEVTAFYDDWAETYDAELTRNGYATPRRCAAALRAADLPPAAPILDMGCGTGLSGLALAREGFSDIDGTDASEGMLAVAARRACYGRLILAGEEEEEVTPGTYDAVVAAGVIGSGAAEPWLFGHSLGLLSPGGLLCLSLNDHSLQMPEFACLIPDAVENGRVRVLSEEYGDHIPGLGSKSAVYVLETL